MAKRLVADVAATLTSARVTMTLAELVLLILQLGNVGFWFPGIVAGYVTPRSSLTSAASDTSINAAASILQPSRLTNLDRRQIRPLRRPRLAAQERAAIELPGGYRPYNHDHVCPDGSQPLGTWCSRGVRAHGRGRMFHIRCPSPVPRPPGLKGPQRTLKFTHKCPVRHSCKPHVPTADAAAIDMHGGPERYFVRAEVRYSAWYGPTMLAAIAAEGRPKVECVRHGRQPRRVLPPFNPRLMALPGQVQQEAVEVEEEENPPDDVLDAEVDVYERREQQDEDEVDDDDSDDGSDWGKDLTLGLWPGSSSGG